jgi:undecaprenyl-diphosphatase
MTALAFWGAYAGGIDRKVALDESGIWNRNVQLGLEYAVIATTVGGSLWLGNDNELGHTFWQTADATVISAVAAQGMKYAFGRQRPNAGQGPNQWFSGGQSFPSAEVTLQASFVRRRSSSTTVGAIRGYGDWNCCRSTIRLHA